MASPPECGSCTADLVSCAKLAHMRPYLLLFLLALLPFCGQSQTQTVTVSAGVPQPVNVSANYAGAAGQNSIFYYVCSAFASGSICQFSPAVAGRTTGISGLGGGNQVTVNWAPGSVGATGYYVMRFATPGFSGQCSNCVIAANVSGTSYVDSSPSTPSGSFPPGGLNPVQQATGNIRLDNVGFQTPGLFWVLNGTPYPFALIQPGSTPGFCLTVSAQPPFTSTQNCSGLGGINQLHGDVLAGPGTGNQNATVVGVNGALVPASTAVLATNAGKQITAATAPGVVSLFSGCSGVLYLGADGACHSPGGGGTITGSGTANNLPKWTASTVLGNADLTDNGNFTSVNAEPFSFATEPGLQAYPNATAGTVVNTISKLNGSAQVLQSTTTDTNNFIGICTIGCGTTGTAHVSFLGQAPCVFDGTANIRDYVQVSTTTNGDCTDAGNSEPTNGHQTIGRVLTANSGAGTTAIVDLLSPDTASHSGGSISFNGTPTSTAFLTDFSGTQIQTPSALSTMDNLGNAVFAASVTSGAINSTGAISAEAGDVSASGGLNAGVGSSTPSAYHFTDTSQVHDTVYNAPSSGYSGTVQMPAAAPTAIGQALTVTTSGTSAVLAWGTPAALTLPLILNANSSALPTPQTGTLLQAGNANGVNTRIEADAFAASSFFTAIRADGTAAARTALLLGDQIGGYNSFGYNGTAVVGPAASFRTFASANWTGSANGTYADVTTTPSASTTAAEVIRFENDGGVTVPSTVTGGDQGAGTINASGLYINGVAVGSAPFHQVGATFSGGGVQTTQVYCCLVAANAGTIKSWDIAVDDGTGAGTCSGCTATVKFLRVATGTTTPSTSNSINTSGVSLSTGTSVSSTTLTDFTSTAVSKGDRFGVQLSAVANASVVTVDFQYQ